MDSKTQQTRQPVITKTVQTQRIGIQVYTLTRHAIGYVLRGRKYIYYGDTRYEVKQGELFYLGTATTTSRMYRKRESPTNRSCFSTRPKTCTRS